MEIELTLKLTDEERESLAQETGWPARDLEAKLAVHGKAGVQEIVDMLVGAAAMDRAADVREHRLMLFITHGGGGIPSETEVSRMFHITPSAARALIRRVLSRYRARIREARFQSLGKIVEACRPDDKRSTYFVVIEDRLLVEAVNEELAALSLGTDVYTRLIPHDLERVEYKMSSRSFEALKKALGK